MESMSTEELRKAKRAMELKILDVISDFSRQTGLMPENVSIELLDVNYFGPGPSKQLMDVRTTVPL